jgi:hypothetical protein
MFKRHDNVLFSIAEIVDRFGIIDRYLTDGIYRIADPVNELEFDIDFTGIKPINN